MDLPLFLLKFIECWKLFPKDPISQPNYLENSSLCNENFYSGFPLKDYLEYGLIFEAIFKLLKGKQSKD